MILREWTDANGKKVTLTSSSGGKSFKNRFKKLLDYHIANKERSIIKTDIQKLTDDYFYYTERHEGDVLKYDMSVSTYINPKTEDWSFEVTIDNKSKDTTEGTGWENFLVNIKIWLKVPFQKTTAYKDLLTEWLDSTGKKVNSSAPASKTSSKANKEKFKELTDYMKANKSFSTTKAEAVRIADDGFTYKETWKSPSGQEFVLTILVGFEEVGSWSFEFYMDTNLISEAKGTGWEDFLKELTKYFNAPKTRALEYDSLLEWVDRQGKKVGQTSTTSTKNYPDQTERYKKLLNQIDSDGFCKYTINLLDDRILAFTISNGVGVKIIFKPYVPCYLVQVDGYDNNCKDWEEVLKLLIIEGIIGDTDLCESASYAEDFKLYENLWN